MKTASTVTGIIFAIASVAVLANLASCNRDLTDDPIPSAIFPDAPINLTFPEYVKLQVDGGFLELSDLKINGIKHSLGVRGIIIYRLTSTNFVVYEKNCSYHPNEACATVNVDGSSLFMSDPCCNSAFSFTDGSPTGGPAWRPLRKYKTYLQNNVLTITSESENGM
ncbi:MAG: hypothetical protein K1X47_02045 [Cyclobacteriaceae bacterium]|nr:hypothetical protein [Cyclobacteriaceae bacterium]